MAVDPTAPNPMINRITFKGNEASATKTKLEQIMEDKETLAAKRYSASELERMAIESENETKRMRGEPPRNNGNGDSTDPVVDTDKKVKVMNSAKALIDAGMDPADVGRMLMGMPPATGNQVIPSTQGMGLNEVVKIVDLITGKKEENDLKSLLVSMNKRLENIESGKIKPRRHDDDDDDDDRPNRKRVDPVTYAKQQIEATGALVEGLANLGLVQKPGAAQGESIELIREKNRHDEKVLEVKAHADYESKIGNAVANLPEEIGKGLGRLVLDTDEEEEHPGNGNKPMMQTFKCPECGTNIIVPPNATQVVCPKCRSIYKDKPLDTEKK